MSKVDEALELLDQIIEKSSIDDKIESSKNSDVALDGDGWITHHLKLVKEMLKENSDAKN
tara:strand:+ start:12111 stop:12290 length:180 start_codon:yes stop_codon:yes gene_type:complete